MRILSRKTSADINIAMSMNQCPSLRYLILISLIIGIGGCAYPISYKLRAKANPDLTYSVVVRDPMAHMGEMVIWGGVITWYRIEANQTVLNVMEKPLDRWGVPRPEAYSRGDFIARVGKPVADGSLSTGRKVILAGDIAGERTEPVDGMQARYPIVKVREFHLFRESYDYSYEHQYYYNQGYRQHYDEPSPFHGIH